MKKQLILMSSLMMVLTGCSVVAHLPDYQARGVNKISADTQLGEFSYLPAERGLVKSNQIENTALNNIYFDRDIAELTKNVTSKELIQSGVNLGIGNLSISGKVKEFKLDDLGFSINFTYIINYKITDIKTAKVLLDRDYSADKKSLSKFGSYGTGMNMLNTVMFSGYEKFINDPEVKRILEKK